MLFFVNVIISCSNWAFAIRDIFYVNKGDVLISSIGFESIGKVQLFNRSGKFGTVSEVTVLRQTKIAPAFVAAFMP